MQQSWWFRFLTSNHVNSTKKCIGFITLDQAPLLCVWAWATTERGWVAFCVLTVSTLDQHLFLCWTRVWSFMTVLAVYFMHVCIGLRPGWLALVVVGVFCVPALCWKLVGLCLYFVFLSCIGSGSRWFVGVCVKPSSCSTSAGRDTAHRGCTYCWKCM